MYELAEAVTEHAIRAILRDLPRDLSETYTRIIDKVHRSPNGAGKVQTMQNVFRWLAGAKRPLRLEELEEAVALTSTDKQLPTHLIARNAGKKLVGDCGNLVVFDDEDCTVVFAHHSVQQYLRDTGNRATPLQVNFDPNAIDEHIGAICLAYLSYSDFETQVTVVPKPMVMNHETAKRLMWWDVPLGPQTGQVISWLQPRGQTEKPRRKSPLEMMLPIRSKLSSSWTQNFVLLEYIIAYWVFHTASLRIYSQHWPLFKAVVSERRLMFEFRPWHDSYYRARIDVVKHEVQRFYIAIGPEYAEKDSQSFFRWLEERQETMLIYSWAMAHGVASLLALIRPSDLDAYMRVVVKDGEDLMLCAELFQQLSRRSYLSLSLQHGFWGAKSIYDVAHARVPGLLGLYKAEFHRWVPRSVQIYDEHYQDAILISLEENDEYVFAILVHQYVNTFVRLMSTLACIIIGKQLRPFAVLTLLSIKITSGEALHDTSLDLFFALQKCIPALGTILVNHDEALSKMDTEVGYILFAAVMTCGDFSNVLRTFLSVQQYMESPFAFPHYDWTKTKFGTRTICQRLQALEKMSRRKLRTDVTKFLDLVGLFSTDDEALPEGYPPAECNCDLYVLEDLYRLKWGFYDQVDDVIKSLQTRFREFSLCMKHKETGSRLLSWAAESSTIVWHSVVALPFSLSDLNAVHHRLQGFSDAGSWPYDDRLPARWAEIQHLIDVRRAQQADESSM